MSTTTDEPGLTVEPAALRAWAEGRTIYLELHDGRTLGFPADRFRLLAKATEEQLKRVQVEIKPGTLIVRPLTRKRHSLIDLLKRIAPSNRHSSVNTGKPIGRETW